MLINVDRIVGLWSRRRLGYAAILIILLLAFGLRLYELSGQSFWYDEMATWNRAVIPFDELMADLLEVRNHVPLYFSLMRAWALIGTNEFVIRYFSVIWAMFGVALTYKNGRLIGGRVTGLIAAILLALSPFHIWYSQEGRMYTMTATLVLLATLFLLRLMRSENRWMWLGYSFALALAIYSHYLVLFILVAHYAFLSLHYRRMKGLFRRWFVTAAAVAGVFAIWGGFMMLTGGFREAPISWIAAANWYDPILTLLIFAAGPTINPVNPIFYISLAALVVTAFATYRLYGWRLPPVENDRATLQRALDTRLLVFWLMVPIILIFIISLDLPIPQKRSIYVDRYLLNSLPALYMLSAWGVSGWARRPSTSRWLSAAAVLAIVLISILSLTNLYFDKRYHRENWRSALAYMIENAEEGDVILGQPDNRLPLAYYAGVSLSFHKVPPAVIDPSLEDDFDQVMAYQVGLAAATADRAWLITHFFNNDPHGFSQERNRQIDQGILESPQYAWTEHNLKAIDEKVFTGVRLTLYDLTSIK